MACTPLLRGSAIVCTPLLRGSAIVCNPLLACSARACTSLLEAMLDARGRSPLSSTFAADMGPSRRMPCSSRSWSTFTRRPCRPKSSAAKLERDGWRERQSASSCETTPLSSMSNSGSNSCLRTLFSRWSAQRVTRLRLGNVASSQIVTSKRLFDSWWKLMQGRLQRPSPARRASDSGRSRPTCVRLGTIEADVRQTRDDQALPSPSATDAPSATLASALQMGVEHVLHPSSTHRPM